MPTVFSDDYKNADGDGTADGGAVYVAITVDAKAVAFRREDARGNLSSVITIPAFGVNCKSATVTEEMETRRGALRVSAVIEDGTTKVARSIDGGRNWTLMP